MREHPELTIYEERTEDLIPYANNAKQHDREQVDTIAASIEDYGFNDPVAVWHNAEGGMEIVEGHGRVLAAKKLGIDTLPVVYLDHLSDQQRREYVHVHNQTTLNSGFDLATLDLELAELDIDLERFGFGLDAGREDARRRFFEQDHVFDGDYSAGGGDEEYSEFVTKFEPKKTTDDCYTPKNVYEAVAGWVVEEYGLDRDRFVRPFYPGGDYEREDYPDGCVVVDNPPFSIIAAIIDFYIAKGVKFFLFAPMLTLFSSVRRRDCCAVVISHSVEYANGAQVATSFVTNLDSCRVRVAPGLSRRVEAADKENRGYRRAAVSATKYEYPDHIVTAARLQRICRAGIPFDLMSEECVFVDKLDNLEGKTIYGGGFLVSDAKAAEKAAAEKAAAEKAERCELSERELGIIAALSGR